MSDRIRLAVLGAGQGLAVWLLIQSWPEAQPARALWVGLVTFVAVSTAVVHFAWTGERLARLFGLAAGTGLLYGLVGTWVGLGLAEPGAVSRAGEGRLLTWTLSALVSLFVLGPFLQIHQRTGRLGFPYPELLLHAWNDFFVGLAGALFTAALWVVLLLWAELFELIGIGVFGAIFREGIFAWEVTGAAVGYGLALGRESERVIATLRGVTLTLFTVLLPLVCFVALLFLAALPMTGLGPLWETDHASHILLAWVAVTVLFFNAVYQEGRPPEALPVPARRVVEAGLLAMAAFPAISAWGLWLRVAQHGLTPARMWGILLCAVLAVYALGYAGAVARRGSPWLPAVQPVNRAVAWLVVALGLLAHTPLLDPLGWSARSQWARLVEGRVAADRFDYGYLRFELGSAGSERFERLTSLESHPEIEAIRAGVARAQEAASYGEWRSRERHPAHAAPKLQAIEVLPPGAILPDGLVDALREAPDLQWLRCEPVQECTLFATEVWNGAPEEWILALAVSRRPTLFVFAPDEPGRFHYRAKLEAPSDEPEPPELASALRTGRVRSVPSDTRDILVGDTRYRLVLAP